MRSRADTAVSWGAPACAAVSTLFYCLLERHAFRDSWFYEGWIFLAHLALAAIGFVLAVVSIRKHPVVGVISAVVTGYFVLIQIVL